MSSNRILTKKIFLLIQLQIGFLLCFPIFSQSLKPTFFTTGKCYIDISYAGKEVDQEQYIHISTDKGYKQPDFTDKVHIAPSTKWEKKMDANCVSSNPDECMAWCLIEHGGFHYYEVTDTTYNRVFATVFYENTNHLSDAKYWIETICPDKVSPNLKEEVNKFLISNNLLDKSESNPQKKELAYRSFQQLKGLPVGMYDIWSLFVMNLQHYLLKNYHLDF